MWLLKLTPIILVLLAIGSLILMATKKKKAPAFASCNQYRGLEDFKALTGADQFAVLVEHVRVCGRCEELVQCYINSASEPLATVWKHLDRLQIQEEQGYGFHPDQDAATFHEQFHLQLCQTCREVFYGVREIA